MTWWGWIIGGAILFGAELAFVSAQFYLVFIGGAAIAVGLLAALASPAPWVQWALFAVLVVVSMIAFRSRVYQRFHNDAPAVKTGQPEGVLTLAVALPPGGTCQAEHGGTYWTVRNDTDSPIAAGTRVRITAVSNLTLLVQPDT
ncbi:MAG: NfeD family protein [Proteobacteria bacterium]|nr:NfeD family protein [Pseudomonadota bacterium]